MDPGGPDPRSPQEPDLAVARLRLRASELRLETPQAPIQLRFQVRNNQLVLVVQTDADDDEAAEAWVSDLSPAHSHTRRSGDHVHRWLVFEPIPERWSDLLTLFELRLVTLNPDGTATTVLHGSREDVQSLVAEASDRDIDLLSIHAYSSGVPDLLTPSQEAAVRAALREGYYQVPRQLSLTELADEMDTSVSALSELLRRAERQVMGLFFGDLSALEDQLPVEGTPVSRTGAQEGDRSSA